MLILTHRVGETIRIDGNIDLTVLSIREQQVRLGVKAPPGVGIHRKELYERIHALLQTRKTCANISHDCPHHSQPLAQRSAMNQSSDGHPEREANVANPTGR